MSMSGGIGDDAFVVTAGAAGDHRGDVAGPDARGGFDVGVADGVDGADPWDAPGSDPDGSSGVGVVRAVTQAASALLETTLAAVASTTPSPYSPLPPPSNVTESPLYPIDPPLDKCNYFVSQNKTIVFNFSNQVSRIYISSLFIFHPCEMA